MLFSNGNKGRLEVICGSMFSGKSEELIRRMHRAEFAKLKTIGFKHSFDDRTSIDNIHSHSGDKIKAIAIESPKDINPFITENIQVIGIDEIQFFSSSIVEIVLELVESGKRVIVAGLDLDFKGQPFGCMPSLLAIADSITKLTAICVQCGNDAHYTQRLINGYPASFNDPIVMIGAQECYQARCRSCYLIDNKYWKNKESNV